MSNAARYLQLQENTPLTTSGNWATPENDGDLCQVIYCASEMLICIHTWEYVYKAMWTPSFIQMQFSRLVLCDGWLPKTSSTCIYGLAIDLTGLMTR